MMTDSLVQRFTMNIVKTSVSQNGERKIRMSASDTVRDFYGERMSTELYHNFVKRIKEPIGGVWKSVLTEKSGWAGGMPYASVSHYHSGANNTNVPADIISVYVDGDVLKSMATIRNTPLGDALWQNLRADANGTSEYEDKIRVSIGFLDLKHRHGDFVFTRDTLESKCPMCENGVGNKTYLDGVLVHEAFTRVPANPRTSVEVDMGKDVTSIEEDAESIVGASLAASLDVERSALDDAMVTKSEDEPAVEAPAAEVEKSVVEPVAEITTIIEVEKSALELAFDELKSQVLQVKSLPKQEALQAIQPAFDSFGQVLQAEFTAVETRAIEVQLPSELSESIGNLTSLVSDLVSRVQLLSDDVTVMKSQRTVVAAVEGEAPKPRNIAPASVVRASTKPAGAKLTIRELAQRNTFGA